LSTITAIVSDTHIGGLTSLSLHEWQCDTGEVHEDGTPITQLYTATLAQDWLYQCWQDFWTHVEQLAGRKHRVIAIHLGDVLEGNHHRTVQAMPNLGDQVGMAVEIMKPIANLCSRTHGALYFIRGTEAHAGEAAQSEVGVAKQLGAPCTWEQIFDIDGILVDCAHHGRAGRRDWTSAAAGTAVEAIQDAVTDNPPRPAPRYVFRGHNHLIDDNGMKNATTRAIAMPAWTLRAAFGYRVASGHRSDIGGVIILPDGSLDLSRLRYYAAPGQRKVLKV
jgi:hypothetical protein